MLKIVSLFYCLNYVNRKNVDHKYLKRYINNRTELLNEVMTAYNVVKDKVKQFFIQLLYFRTFES